jgi:hypothetical protein
MKVNKKMIEGETKTKRMTGMKLLSFEVGIILVSISLFVHVGDSETFGEAWLYFCENPSAHGYFSQRDIVDTSKNIIGVWDKTVSKAKFVIEMVWRFGLCKRFSTSERPKMILVIFMVCWAIAIIFVLAIVFYRIVVGPLIEKRLKKDKNRSEG